MQISSKQKAKSTQDYRLTTQLRTHIAACLDDFPRASITTSTLRQAAVAFTLVDALTNDTACFLLTRRQQHLGQHSGQYALPGGKTTLGESVTDCALRELYEEIGIEVSSDDVLGVLDDYATRSGFNITPVVVWAGSNRELQPDANEVAETFRIPLFELVDARIPILEQSAVGDAPIISVPLATVGHEIYAPTAAIIYQFREVVLFQRNTRVAHYDQPKFAWS